MKIKKINIYQHNLPVKNPPYTMSNSKIYHLETTLVEIIADNGLVGWGETCPLSPTYAEAHSQGALAALKVMVPDLIGENLLHPLLLQRKINSLLEGHNYAKAAIDIAIFDLIGKFYKVRVADLLGGVVTENLPSYYAIGIVTPEEVVEIAKEKVKQQFSKLQIKIGGRDIAIDIEVIHKVWQTVGNKVRLVVDGNRGMSTKEIIRFSNECRNIPLVLEQSCNTIEEMKVIRNNVHHPIHIDEGAKDISTILRIIGEGLVDGFGMKIGRVGGFLNMQTIRNICEVRNLSHSCEDSWGGDIVVAACTHMGATISPRLLDGVWIAEPYIAEHYDENNPVKIENGHIQLPKGVGLGVIPDKEKFGKVVFEVD